ncbi:MAG: DUF6629 family protein [Lyngbya sp.]|nr:DUF6629 family protein [Lyngbya sp.]
MCFSAFASFTAAATLCVLGTATLFQTPSKKELLLGVFPILFAIQQFCEGLVWLSLDSSSFLWLNSAATYGFLFFATSLWLVLSPLAIYYLEKPSFKRPFILILAGLGFLLGCYLFGFSFVHGVYPQVFSGNLLYDLQFLPFYELTKYVYLLIIVMPFLLATQLWLQLFGVMILASFIFTTIFYTITFVSVWCFFAAILSGSLYLRFRYYPSQL